MDSLVVMATPDVQGPMEIEGSLGRVAPRDQKGQQAVQETEDQ